MKLLAIHADFIEVEAKKKAFKGAEEDVGSGDSLRIEECLVVFTAAEKEDEKDEKKILSLYVSEVKDLAAKVNCNRIVLYPYAHLSSSLSNPSFAVKVMKAAEAELRLIGDYEVSRAPFGWYKSFNISCKGHPLSEASRNLSVDTPLVSSSPNLKREHKDESFVFEARELSSDEKINLSSTLVLAAALKALYPQVVFGDCGFYQDQAYLDFSGIKLQQNQFSKIKKQMRRVLKSNADILSIDSSEAIGDWQKNILSDLGDKATVYRLLEGESAVTLTPRFIDSFVSNISELVAFDLVGLGSVYWKGNQENEQLMRIRLVGFSSEEKLASWQKALEDAKNRSHIKIGKEQGLYVMSDLVGAGMPLMAPKGMIIREEIVNFLWSLHKSKGYQKVCIPHIAKTDLYKTSGHWDKFGDELFKVKGQYEDFVLKPMNCPHHTQIFAGFKYSYRDLPIRYFEPTVVYRDEKPGQLTGLSRVRAITQDDGHIFCRVDQIEEEVKTMIEVILEFYRTLGMDTEYWVSLSVRGNDKSKYLGSDEVWEIAEGALQKVADENALPYRRIEGEAAFYGPKLDFMFKDALGREWQLATIQCDFNLPERFDLSYVNSAGEKERPVMIHRAISGSLERFMSVLIEHFAGKYPLWLNPIQVKVLTVADRHNSFADSVVERLSAFDFRVERDYRQETIGKKVREAQVEQASYILTIGDKEIESGKLAVRNRDTGKTEFGVEIDAFVSSLTEERDSKRL